MRITELEIHGLKGLQIKLAELGPVVKISGRNRAGKTTIFDAIQIATCGRLPQLSPEENSKTAGIMRKLGPEEGYEIKMACEIESLSGNLARASYKVTKDLVDFRGDLPRVSMADASSFFKATGPARIKMIIEAADLLPYEGEFAKLVQLVRSAFSPDYQPAGGSLVECADDALRVVTTRQSVIRELVKELGDKFEPDAAKPLKQAMEAELAILNENLSKLADMQASARVWHQKESLSKPPTEEHIADLEAWRAGATKRIRALIGQNTELITKIRAAEDRARGIEILEVADKCRHCGADRAHWKGVMFSLEEISRQNEESQAQLEAIEKQVTAWRQEIQINKPELDELETLSADLVIEITAAQQERKAYADLMDVIKPSFTEQDLAEIQATIDHYKGTQAADAAMLKEWDEFDNWILQRAKYDDELKVLKPIAKQLRDWNKTLSERVFASVLEIGNKITSAVFGFEFEFHNKDLIYWRDGVAVNFQSMSGSERALATLTANLGLQLASGARIALIDEFAAFNPEVQKDLESVLQDAIEAGDLDQVWIIEPSDSDLVVS